MTSISYTNGNENFKGDIDRLNVDTLIYDGARYKIVNINSKTIYNEQKDSLATGGWMLGGADPKAYLFSPPIQDLILACGSKELLYFFWFFRAFGAEKP